LVVRADGTLLDGSHLHDAVHRIDATIQPAPLMYMVNCTHPTTFAQAMQTELKQVSDLHRRVMGLQANASSKSPEELDRLPYVDAGDPQDFAELMVDLPARFGTKILGGCCGTDARHIRRIAELAGKGIL
jgi:homocysteine S-methyltransferase